EKDWFFFSPPRFGEGLGEGCWNSRYPTTLPPDCTGGAERRYSTIPTERRASDAPGPRRTCPMLPPDVVRQIRRLHLRARRAVQDLLGGEYHSACKGTGLAFADVRAYEPGDDVRAIDWNVTARMGQ